MQLPVQWYKITFLVKVKFESTFNQYFSYHKKFYLGQNWIKIQQMLV